MRLTVRNESTRPAVGRFHVHHLAGGWRRRQQNSHGDQRLVLTTAVRAICGFVRELWEGLLQLLGGVEPYVPRIRVCESRRTLTVIGHLARVEEDSVDVVYDGRSLLISGAKLGQRERSGRRRRFERNIPLYCDVDEEKIVATLRDDVLRIHVPKSVADG